MSIGHNGDIATVYNVGKINKDNIPSATKIVAVVGSKPLDMPSKHNVSQNSDNVNAKSDKDYLDAVNRGDTETAQKMVDDVALVMKSQADVFEDYAPLITLSYFDIVY